APSRPTRLSETCSGSKTSRILLEPSWKITAMSWHLGQLSMLGKFGKHTDWSALGLLLIFLIGAPVVIFLMSQRIEYQGATIRAGWVAQIEAIALSRAQQIDNWVEARRTEVEVLASAPSVRALLTGVESDREELLAYLDRMAAAYRYASIAIFDAHG